MDLDKTVRQTITESATMHHQNEFEKELHEIEKKLSNPRVAELIKENDKARAVFLIDENKERIKEIIYTRGLWDDARKYSDDVKEKEVEWVFAYNKWLKRETKRFSLPVVEVGNRDSYIQEVKKLVG